MNNDVCRFVADIDCYINKPENEEEYNTLWCIRNFFIYPESQVLTYQYICEFFNVTFYDLVIS